MRVLIVEDELHLAEALTELLMKQNYSVDAVNDGISGMDYALSGVYDLVILDIMLPLMNGIDVLKNLRKANLATPVLLLTAKDDIGDKVTGLDSGADDYLTKPFETEELLARVRAMSRRRGNAPSNILSFGDVCLNLNTCGLSCGNHQINLPLKEFQIMELLLTNGKNITTKERFIEKIWGFDSYAEYNNVEVYISFIRKKLTHIQSQVEIKTARGMGYSLC